LAPSASAEASSAATAPWRSAERPRTQPTRNQSATTPMKTRFAHPAMRTMASSSHPWWPASPLIQRSTR
jgi:hypothetical protein